MENNMKLSLRSSYPAVMNMAETIIDKVVNGEIDPVEVDYFCYCLEKFAEKIRKNERVNYPPPIEVSVFLHSFKIKEVIDRG